MNLLRVMITLAIMTGTLLLAGCPTPISTGTGTGTETETGTEQSIPGKTIVHFEIPGGPSFSVARATGETAAPDEIVYVNVLDESPQIAHQILEDGDNQIILDKDGLYLLGFVDVNDAANGGITPVGNLSLAQVGTSSLPLAPDAGDNLYLGTLTFSDGKFETDLLLSEIESGTGYSADELSDIARFDHTLTRFLNPDIDRNGVWDVDEQLFWDFRADYPISLDFAALIVAQPGDAVQPEWLNPNVHPNLVYWSVNRDYTVSSWDDFSLELPQGIAATHDGQAVTSVGPYQFEAGFPTGGGYVNFEFIGAWDPQPPFDGDYVVHIGTDRYSISNAQFPQAATGFEGVPLMIWSLRCDEYGVYHTAEISWRMVIDGMLAIPNMTSVSTQLTHASLDFGPQGLDMPGTSVPVSTDQASLTVDLSSYGLAQDTHWVYPAAIQDISLNGFQFNVHDSSGAPEPNIVPYTSGEAVSVDVLQGDWLNADYDSTALASRLVIQGSVLETFMESGDTEATDAPVIYTDRDSDPADGRFFLKAVTPDPDGNPTTDAHFAAEVTGDVLSVWFSPTPGVQPDPDADQSFTYTRQ